MNPITHKNPYTFLAWTGDYWLHLMLRDQQDFYSIGYYGETVDDNGLHKYEFIFDDEIIYDKTLKDIIEHYHPYNVAERLCIEIAKQYRPFILDMNALISKVNLELYCGKPFARLALERVIEKGIITKTK